MQTVQSAHVLTVGARLATEASRVGGIAYGQVLLVQDDVAVDIGHRHLSRGDEVEVVHADVVHLPLLVGELARAVARVLIDDVGRLHLGEACLTCVVEEEVDERALQACPIALVDGEARARDLDAELEVYEVVGLCQLPVGGGVGRQLGVVPAHLDADVVLSRRALGHDLSGEIGDLQQDLADTSLCLVLLFLELAAKLLEVGDLGAYLLGLILQSLLHQGTDLLGDGILLRQACVELLLGAAAQLVEVEHLSDVLARLEVLLL